MKLRCINNEGALGKLELGGIYEAGDSSNSLLYQIVKDCKNRTAWYSDHRFEKIEDRLPSVKYFQFTVRTYLPAYDHKVDNDGVVSSTTGFFPMKQVTSDYESRGMMDVVFMNVIEISEEDYNWKYAEISKFGEI